MEISDVIRYQTLDIPCHNCGEKHARTVGWLDKHNQIKCLCGEHILIDKQRYQLLKDSLESRFQKYLVRPTD